MKFHLNHDPANKTLTIPRAALQLSGLADVSDLILHTDGHAKKQWDGRHCE